MRIKFKKLKNLRFILQTVALLFFIIAVDQFQEDPFAILKQRLQSGRVLHAQFNYQYFDSFTNNTSASAGTLWIGRAQYKVVSNPKTILVDGETSKVYDANRNRLIISKYVPEDDDFAPSRILNGIDSTYTLVQQAAEENRYIIKLQSQDSFSLYERIKITLNRQYVPLEIQATDRAGNIITTTFNDGSYINGVSSVFNITYPDDVKIIDLRK